jgi:hypothetical protein
MPKAPIPKELEPVKELALRAIAPIKPLDRSTKSPAGDQRTNAGRKLPPYYLVYFLLVDLVEFPSSGQDEKVAWSVPIDFEGDGYVIEHRKFGVGIFAGHGEDVEKQATRILSLIRSGVKAAKPFLRWVADSAVEQSKLNVINNGRRLFERYVFFRDGFKTKSEEAEKRRDEQHVERTKFSYGQATTIRFPAYEIARNASWLALSAIDAFYSWTEHIFIHLAILQGRLTTGHDVAELAGAEWGMKFKVALDITDKATKIHFDELTTIRRQLRNFMAHGAFGKEGEAFSFHSGAGAVPVAFERRHGMPRFSITPELAFDDGAALAAIERFITFLWSGARAPARIYLQEWDLPLILPMATDGTYARAMSSVDEMNEFAEYLGNESDNAANMDW